MGEAPEQPWLRQHAGRAGVVAAFVALLLVGWFVWQLHFAPQTRTWGEVAVNGRYVQVRYVGSECDRADRVLVDESDDEVVLTLQVTDWSFSCSDVGVPRTVVVRLDRPVGTRQIVDGGCGSARRMALDCGDEPGGTP